MAALAEFALHIGLGLDEVEALIATKVVPITGPGVVDIDTARVAYIRHLREQAAGRGEVRTAKSDEDGRRMRAQADIAEMEVGKLKGRLVEVEQIAEALSAAVIASKSSILGLPSKLAGRIGKDPRVAEKVMREELTAILNRLSETKVIGGHKRGHAR